MELKINREKRIGIVMQNDYPHIVEIRAMKFIQTLNKFNYKPIVVCAAGEGKGEYEKTKTEIIYHFPRTLNALCRYIHVPSPINFLWVFFINKTVKEEDISLLICSNIRIALPAIIAARILSIPVVLDLQENNAEVVAYRTKNTWAHIFTRNKFVVYILELICVHLADVVWTVTEEMRDRVKRMGVSFKKIVVIYNVPAVKTMPIQQKYKNEDHIFTLIYVGMLEKMRGLDIFVEALYCMVQKNIEIQLNIIGYGDYQNTLEKLIKTRRLEKNIRVLGKVQREDVPDYLLNADVGIIPHQVNPFTNTTIPNKLFDYMAAALPVITTDMIPVRRIINEEKCGMIIPPKATKEDIARAILLLKESHFERMQMGQRGVRAIKAKYNWGIESEKCIRSIESLI